MHTKNDSEWRQLSVSNSKDMLLFIKFVISNLVVRNNFFQKQDVYIIAYII